MGYHGQQETRNQVGAAFFGMELRHREEVTHHYAKKEMPRHGEQGSHHTSTEAKHEDVFDVFHTGKSQSDESGIDDAVEVFIKVLVAPDEQHENEEFGELLWYARFEESTEKNGFGNGTIARQVLYPSDNENAYGGGLLNPRVAGVSVRLVRDNN